MAERPVTRAEALDLARLQMRASFYGMLTASEEVQAQTKRINSEWAHDPANARHARKSDIHRADAMDSWEFHAKNVGALAAFITAETSLAALGVTDVRPSPKGYRISAQR